MRERGSCEHPLMLFTAEGIVLKIYVLEEDASEIS
jgi:hypothetical protein